MATTSTAGSSAALPHRSVTSIRTTGTASKPVSSTPNPASPSTPLRNPLSTSAFSSPAGLRADEDTLVIELGSRHLRVGFAGDALPKAVVSFGPESARRVGDFRAYEVGYVDDWRRRRHGVGERWGNDYEFWRYDVRGLDLELVGDRLERGLREAFSRDLLLDSRGRKAVLVLPPSMPLPLLGKVLDVVIGKFMSPSVGLVSAPVMTAFAAGTRAALVVDLGWTETVVSAVCEYREVGTRRSVRGGKMLVGEVHGLLKERLKGPEEIVVGQDGESEDVVSFRECEDITRRMVWCRPGSGHQEPTRRAQQERLTEPAGLPTVREEQEECAEAPRPSSRPIADEIVSIPLTSSTPPTAIQMPFSQLAEPCETTFFGSQYESASFDSHEQPIPELLYRVLLDLPMDVRAICMARIIFTGGFAKVLGLRGRLFHELSKLVEQRGWERVHGKAVEALRTNPKPGRRGSSQAQADGSGPTPAQEDESVASPTITTAASAPAAPGAEIDGVWDDAASIATTVVPSLAPLQPDPIEAQFLQRRGITSPTQLSQLPQPSGVLRAIESLGPWAGASLLASLKTPVVATVERDAWLAQGLNGASRPQDVEAASGVGVAATARTRQSMGAGRQSGIGIGVQPWTFGVWGAV